MGEPMGDYVVKVNLSEKRSEERVKKNVLVYSNNGSLELLGISANLSRNGVYIESPNPGIGLVNGEVSIIIAVDEEEYNIKGEIRWLKQPGDKEPEHVPSGLGIRIVEAPAEYLNYVEYLRHCH